MLIRNRDRNKESGFTVVELLISIGLFGVVMPSIILAIMSLNIINDRAGDLAYANAIAESKIESLRSAGYNSLSVGTVSFTGDLPATFDDTKSASYTVTDFGGSSSGIKEIEVAISYRSYTKTVSLSYKTLISELGVSQ